MGHRQVNIAPCMVPLIVGPTSTSKIITTHDVSHHMYADDTQVYIQLSQWDTHKSISSLSDCLTDISLWI